MPTIDDRDVTQHCPRCHGTGKWWLRPGMPVPTDDNDLDLCRWWAQWYRDMWAEQAEYVQREDCLHKYHGGATVGAHEQLAFYRQKIAYYEQRVADLAGVE
jgi:hypothetical protein